MLLSIILYAGLLSADLHHGTDVPFADSLQTVRVTADKGRIISRTDTLSVANSFIISDVLFQNPGLYVGDNGGYAGLKTVSLRGLGSAHTSVYLDGVRIGNVQSGQNDLGMIGLENCEWMISIAWRMSKTLCPKDCIFVALLKRDNTIALA